MRVLYVFHSLAHWGGIERILVDKMNYLVSVQGDEVFMLTTAQGSHSMPYQLAESVKLMALGVRFHQQYCYRGLKRLLVMHQLKLRFRQLLSEQLQIIQPDVIVCTTSSYIDLDILAHLKGTVPLVVESHSICQRTLGQGGWSHFYKDYIYRRALKKAAIVVALTKQDAADWRKFGLNTCVIPNMVHLNEGACSDQCQQHVIFVGRLDYQKRPMTMISIWQKVFPCFPNWHLDIYGEGDQRQEIEKMVAVLGMNIHLYSPTVQIFDRYRESSVLVSTSLFEPFGLVIPEAMSCGLSVVAFDCPYGPAEIITDEVDGFLVKDGDETVFADRLSRLMGDKKLRERMGRSAVLTAQRYSSECVMPQWHDLFESLKK